MLRTFSVAILLCSSQQIRTKGFLSPSSQIQTNVSHLDISLPAVKTQQNKVEKKKKVKENTRIQEIQELIQSQFLGYNPHEGESIT